MTQQQADERFLSDLGKFEQGVKKAIGDAPTTQNQFDAFVSLAYNIGVRAFSASSLVRKHIAKDYKAAASAFLLWNKSGGRVMAGLARRRAAEAALYGSE